MSDFEISQRGYYTHELNRVLPTRATTAVDMRVALGSVDPIFPIQDLPEARAYVSDFSTSATSTAMQREAACRAIPYPGSAMRVADARVGCGWAFNPDPSMPSTAAYGTRRGPMDSKLALTGQWVWDPQEAYRLEGQKQTAKIGSCPDLLFNQFDTGKVGWCPSTGRAIMTDGSSPANPAFPQMAGGDCPGGGIIMSAANCPPPAPPPGSGPGPGPGPGSGPQGPPGPAALCSPGAGGAYSPACLQSLTNTICSSNGLLSQSLGSGYAGTSPQFNTANAYLLQRGFTIHPGLVNDGRVAINDALASVTALKGLANTPAGSRETSAAGNLCFGTAFDPCAMSPTDAGPFDPDCVRKVAIGLGYSPNGRAITISFLSDPSNVWTNGGLPTWGAVLNDISRWKAIADDATRTDAQRVSALSNVYGIDINYPSAPTCPPS